MNATSNRPHHFSSRIPVAARLRLASYEQSLPRALHHWRVTCSNMHVAERLHGLLGGSAPAHFPSEGQDGIEVLTATSQLRLLLDGSAAVQTRYIAVDGAVSDGRSLTSQDGTSVPDPNRDLSFCERHRLSRSDGSRYVTSVYARLADAPELDVLFRSTSWDLAERWQRAGHATSLTDHPPHVPAVLAISRRTLGERWTVAAADLHLTH